MRPETTITVNPWDRFAKEDPTFYIATHTRWRWREEDAFWRSGEQTVVHIWNVIERHLTARRVAVEIGVGIGRLAVPMAKRFRRLKVVDRSRVMLEQLRIRCASHGACNVASFHEDDAWDAEPMDFVYSALTFQHVVDDAIIERYLTRVAAHLAGVAYLQFDTRPQNVFARWRDHVPDRALPRAWQGGMRRIRRRSSAIREMFTRNILAVLEELNPESSLHAFVIARAPPPPPPVIDQR